MIPGRMSGRQQLIRDAFAAYQGGNFEPLRALFAPDARWVGVPQGPGEEDTPTCHDRGQIVGRLEQHHQNGRRFTLGEMIEQGDRVAAEITIENPRWSGPVRHYKVFAFRPGEDVVVRLNDCIDESYALQVLAA